MSTTESHTPSPVLTCGVLKGDIVRLAVNTPLDAVVEDLAIRPAGML